MTDTTHTKRNRITQRRRIVTLYAEEYLSKEPHYGPTGRKIKRAPEITRTFLEDYAAGWTVERIAAEHETTARIVQAQITWWGNKVINYARDRYGENIL